MPILRHVLSDGDVSVSILNLGCILHDWRVPLNGQRVPVVLGYSDPESYAFNPGFMGALVGRVANRISGARFDLAGETVHLPQNEAPHHLHGGTKGLHARLWDMEPDGDTAVRLSLVSDHLDQGYPGVLTLQVTIRLTGYDLTYDIHAQSDRPTPVNLAQHAYYNLVGGGSVGGHGLMVPAKDMTPVGPGLIPTGEIRPVAGTELDFRDARLIGSTRLDSNLVLEADDRPICLQAPKGMTMQMWTDQPCLQVYTAQGLLPFNKPLHGQIHGPFAGICLEPQQYPDALNVPRFPFAMTTPETPYKQVLRIRIAPPEHA